MRESLERAKAIVFARDALEHLSDDEQLAMAFEVLARIRPNARIIDEYEDGLGGFTDVFPPSVAARLWRALAKRRGMPIVDIAREIYDAEDKAALARTRSLLAHQQKLGHVRSYGHGRWELAPKPVTPTTTTHGQSPTDSRHGDAVSLAKKGT